MLPYVFVALITVLNILEMFLMAYLPFYAICKQLGCSIGKVYWLIFFPFYLVAVNLPYFFEPFLFIAYFYILFRLANKKNRAFSFFNAAFIVLSYDTFHRFFRSVMTKIIDLDSLYHLFFNFFLAVSFVEYLVPLFFLILVLKNIDLRFDLLEKDDFKKIVCKANIIFIALLLSMAMWTIIMGNHAILINTFGSTISLVHLLLFLYVAQYLKSQQNTYMVHQEIKRREDENKELNQFVNKLGSLYDEIRGFRHDFAGIIASLAPVIQERNINEIELVYKDVLLTTNANLQKLDYSAFDLKNIDDLAFRNALAKAMLEAEKQGVTFKCDVPGHIPVVDISMLDMIRILSILLTNAVEAAQEADKPLVEVAITNKNNVITVMIYNTRSKIPLNKRRIWEKGVSSKGDDRGLGLYNLKKLLGDYPQLSLETKVGQEDFTQIMTIQ